MRSFSTKSTHRWATFSMTSFISISLAIEILSDVYWTFHQIFLINGILSIWRYKLSLLVFSYGNGSIHKEKLFVLQSKLCNKVNLEDKKKCVCCIYVFPKLTRNLNTWHYFFLLLEGDRHTELALTHAAW